MGWSLFPYVVHCLFHCLLLLHFPSHASSAYLPLCNRDDSSALLQFKDSVALNPSVSKHWCSSFPSKTRSWETGTNCCQWDGVTCDTMSGHVIGLDLSCGKLQGELHPNSTLFHLTHLQQLNLAFNDFSGSSIYPGIGDLVSLAHLNLSDSSFVGDIPATISHLSKLVSLDLSYNDIADNNLGLRLDPSTWNKLILNATNLEELVLSGVNMSSIKEGSFSLLMNLSSSLVSLQMDEAGLHGNFPRDVLCLPNLQELSLSFNEELRGELPKSNWSVPLKLLDLSATAFSGEVPNSIGHLKSLSELWLWNCRFDGLVPLSLWNLTQLTDLSLAGNRLSGEIPSLLSHLNLLTSLDLESNNFSGQIPDVFGNITNLEFFTISNNSLGGQLPSSLFDLTQLSSLDLSSNNFSGQIPDVFGNITNLEFFTISNNSLGGQLPSSLFDLTQLSFLDLSSNNFSGQIPDVFDNITNLEFFIISNNNLGGHLPSSLFDLTQLSILDLSSNNFEGPIPSKTTKVSKLDTLALGDNLLNGTIPRWCYSLPSLSMLDLSNNKLTGPISEFSSYSLRFLFLSNNMFQGKFPNSIFEFENLTILSLSSTNLSGQVEFHRFSKFKKSFFLDLSDNNFLLFNIDNNVDYILPNLDLYLSSCNLTKFPQFMLRLRNLQSLDLSGNKIHGKIPKWFHDNLLHSWKNIGYIDLSFNKLQGDLPIPPYGTEFFSVSNNNLTGDISSSMCNASSLQVLILSHNNLTGMIPQCLGMFPSLSILDLQMNNLHGSIPTSFSKSNEFETIKLNDNMLDGPLPKSLAHCTNLEVLDLGDNHIQDVFPSWLEILPKLQVLILRANKFHGIITSFSTKHPFSKLRIFDVSNNNFRGPLPTSYLKKFQGMINVNDSQSGLKYMGGFSSYNDSVVVVMKGQFMELQRILTTFTTIDLSNNMFEGEVPQVIGELKSLKGLNLSHNAITGTIPQSLGNLRNLEWLDLSWNQLRGEIPMALTNLNFLSVLNLSQNQLEGVIPTGKQFNTFQNDSYGGNAMLCGTPLSKSCSHDEEQPPSTFHCGEKFGFGWKPVAVGYACGVVFGMLLGCCFFLSGKPLWLARLVGMPNKRAKGTNKKACANCRRTN